MTQDGVSCFPKASPCNNQSFAEVASLLASSEACFPKPRADGACFPSMNHSARRVFTSPLRSWSSRFVFCFSQTLEEPPYLTVGTDVSAKYRGAFCEAKIKTAKRLVKAKVSGVFKKLKLFVCFVCWCQGVDALVSGRWCCAAFFFFFTFRENCLHLRYFIKSFPLHVRLFGGLNRD